MIDSGSSHDAGRYSLRFLENQLNKVLRYGRSGVCYYLLHHLLDILIDRLVSIVVGAYRDYLDLFLECPLRDVTRYFMSLVNKEVKRIKEASGVFSDIISGRVTLSDEKLTRIVREYLICLITLLEASVEYITPLLMKDKGFLRKIKSSVTLLIVWQGYSTEDFSTFAKCIYKALGSPDLNITERRLTSVDVSICKDAYKDIDALLKAGRLK